MFVCAPLTMMRDDNDLYLTFSRTNECDDDDDDDDEKHRVMKTKKEEKEKK